MGDPSFSSFELLFIAVIIGVIPGYLAYRKGHSFKLWWLAGFLIFIFALPAAIFVEKREDVLRERKGLKKCPNCAEDIKVEAKVCRHCNAVAELSADTLPS